MRESDYLEGQLQLVERLRQIPMFKMLDPGSIENLLKVCKIRTFDSYEPIIIEGVQDSLMYFLISGSVKVIKGERTVARFRRTGDVFGEMGILNNVPHTASVTTLEPTSCLSIDASQLDNIPGEETIHAVMYRIFAQILAERLRITTEMYLAVKQELDHLRRTGLEG